MSDQSNGPACKRARKVEGVLMKLTGILALSLAALTSLGAGEALADDGSIKLKEYLDYEVREPCQFYQPPPAGYVVKGCRIVRAAPSPEVLMVQEAKQESYLNLEDVLISYQVHFALGDASIEPAAAQILSNVARDIRRYNPREILLAGHTDRSGTDDYNLVLSQRRAVAVAKALNDRGIATRIIDQQAFGESEPAVPTQDGVALFANRRVQISFMK